jgi:hypothetical protein
MLHSDDDIPLFVPAVDVPVRLHHLFQRTGPIDDRFQGARLGQFLEVSSITMGKAALPVRAQQHGDQQP